ncbi:TetR/AcrR family transcriptional regulator [Peterkaempfera sp. SMS 1(5)a]|uniref:TetR/AcrR family transcriptional regulator n=1 Tax=Peterkaempfera podocarpi TaxID=3232308 RepID=UPI00366DB987
MSEPADRPAPRSPKGERTRARILASAAELFSKSGFHAVSLRDIAAHAGMTHAGLLHHFSGKEALLIELLGRRDEDDAAVLLGTDPATSPRRFLEGIVGIVDRNMHTPALVGMYAKISAEAADPDHPAHRYFTRRYQILRGLLGTAFGALAALGEVHPDVEPLLTAGQLLALMDGLQTQWLLEPDAVDMRASVVDFLTRVGLDLSTAPLFPVGLADQDGVPAGPEPTAETRDSPKNADARP